MNVLSDGREKCENKLRPHNFIFFRDKRFLKVIRKEIMTETKEEGEVTDLTEAILRGIQLYYTPILVYLGSLGNCLSVCVFFGTKLRRSSSSIYLGALAISDTGFLISVFVVWLNMVNIGIFNEQGFCQFFIYLTTLCSFLSVWFVVAFTVERFVAVQYPFHRQSMCTVARAKTVVIGLTVLGIMTCSPTLWFSSPRLKISNTKNVTECLVAEGWESSATIFNSIDAILTFVVPFTVIVVLNILIARAIYRLAKVRRILTTESRASQDQMSCSQSPRNTFAQSKITKMLLIVSTVFLCLNLPAYAIRVHAFLYPDNNPPRSIELAQQVCNLFFNTNFGINFILYCTTGQNFRSAMIRMFLRRSHGRNDAAGRISNHGNIVSELARNNTLTSRQKAPIFTKSWQNNHELQIFSKEFKEDMEKDKE
ncbi:thyrotropin-releasing hormone receptor isoform X2 [Vespa velutina]|uniref:thyrotropin-releasing hormone receptor isoform X2 n=1 Tax=Vespa velutina TaxID=202808 RepID=UPI001FB49EBA|nr:thyrotropin-releasing hormone receptor isoform X2 [Vespa velutina]